MSLFLEFIREPSDIVLVVRDLFVWSHAQSTLGMVSNVVVVVSLAVTLTSCSLDVFFSMS